jgi:EAL domain-containing protein (putative c-di-GMP-specific phosphodiesterase class I)
LGTTAAKDNIIKELEALSAKRLTHALRSIGCHIVIENYNPARSSSEAIHELHASDIILEANFWERAAQNEPWATVLPQIISDVHHILGHTVTVRNPQVTHNIESSGID